MFPLCPLVVLLLLVHFPVIHLSFRVTFSAIFLFRPLYLFIHRSSFRYHSLLLPLTYSSLTSFTRFILLLFLSLVHHLSLPGHPPFSSPSYRYTSLPYYAESTILYFRKLIRHLSLVPRALLPLPSASSLISGLSITQYSPLCTSRFISTPFSTWVA